MNQNTIAQLKQIDWFEELPEEIVAALAQKVSKRKLSKDEILFHKGDIGDSLFVILSGRVKVITHDKDGNEVALNKVGAGEIIGEMALLDNETRSAGVVALEKTYTLELNREDFMKILKGHPDLALSVIRNLSSRLRHNTSYIEQIAEMSRNVAKGDYSFISKTQSVRIQRNKSNEQDKVGQLMEEFISMVQGVREREEDLKNQVQKLTLQIDEGRRKQEVDDITSTDFYAKLKEQAEKLRAQRKDKR
ncbi:MAG: cyclic nucleotide-binding domain-containing protein [Anaerolineales bacterium]